MLTVKHSGAIGDIIYALPYLKSLDTEIVLYVGEHTFVTNLENQYTPGYIIQMINNFFPSNKKSKAISYTNYDMVCPILELQSYIVKVLPLNDNVKVDLDLDTFRKNWNPDHHIASQYFYHFNSREAAWRDYPTLENIPVNPEFFNNVVCCRSLRYRISDGGDRWKDCLTKVTSDLTPIFVGLDVEYEDFCSEVSSDIVHYKTKNLLDVAVIINSCKYGIYNGSSPLAIACMLMKNHYVECEGMSCKGSIATSSNIQRTF